MSIKEYETILNDVTNTGCDFADIFYEEATTKSINLVNKKIDNIYTKNIKGIGIRTSLNESPKYASTSDLSKINELVELLKSNYHTNRIISPISLKEIKPNNIIKPKIKHNELDINKKIELLKKIDTIARNYSKLITQVSCSILEYDRYFKIANSNNIYTKSNYINTRILLKVVATKDNNQEALFDRFGAAMGYELLDNINIEEFVTNLCEATIKKLDAIEFSGGEYPIILENGFGAVLFHEACGHGLEATSVAPKLSYFSDKLNKQIATSKVTLIDDASINNTWGSINIDDEGNYPQKKILIDKGILKSFMVDSLHEKQMNTKSTGSGRRENYHYQPTSRMTNTYIEKGNDDIKEMFKSIDYGVYCKNLGGGLVDTNTGNFNFDVTEAYLIEKGTITKPLKGLCLIGTSSDILNKVEMVANNLILSDGYCGSKSGMIPVTIGEPTIKISSIQIGGKE